MGQRNFFIGLDLGQAQDFTALCFIEQVEEEKLKVRDLKRWPLRTSYKAICAQVAAVINGDLLRSENTALLVDCTGVGAGVFEMLSDHGLHCDVMRVVITAGAQTSYTDGVHKVPKTELVSAVQVRLQNGELSIPTALSEALTLKNELQNFQVKITVAGNEQFGEWRVNQHDDLVLATALAVWGAGNRAGIGIFI